MADVTWGLLLAAGESTRMGTAKPLLPWDGMTLVQWQIDQLRKAGCRRIVVVLGSRADEVIPLVAATGADYVINQDYRQGRASSLRAGASAIDDGASRIVILSVDQPRPSWVTARLIKESVPSRAAIVAPRYEGRGGHPLVLDSSLLAELREVAEETLGLRALTERHASDTKVIRFDNGCVIVDLNTPDEYEAALAAFNRGEWEEDSAPSLQTG